MKTLVWIGDAPDMPTGFGNELKQFISYLPEYSHIVVDPYQSKFTRENEKYRSFSMGRLREEDYEAFKEFDIDAVFTLGSLWTRPDALRIKQLYQKAKWIALYRVDGLPLNLIDMQILKNEVDKTVVPSKWLEDEFKRKMISCERIPEGVSLDLFKKLDDEKRKKLREPLEGKLVYGCTNRNIFPRKFYCIMLKAFAEFAKDKNDVQLLLHCDPKDREGLPLAYLVELLGLGDKILFSAVRWDTGAALQNLVDVYNQMDIWISTSGGEAFGRGYTEAMACGCNIIAPDHTSFSELIRGHGLGIKNQSSFFLPKVNYFIKIPSVEDTIKQMDLYYKQVELREKHKEIARGFIKQYDIIDVMESWKKHLEAWI